VTIRVYNSLNNRKEEFVPMTPGKANIYVCGVTPYNHPHIGNARPFVTWDVIRRFLEHEGYDVTHVQNFTDVDDKIINTANKEGVQWFDICNRYIDSYFEVMDKLNVRRAHVYPRVSEHIEDIIGTVQSLIDNGYAYVVDGDVFYSVEKFKHYGQLSGRNIEDMMAGARVDVDDRKQNPMDFALWKSAKPGEPSWPSPWGNGRPGWHIECSCISMKHLGEDLDIHAGGIDNAFPHHTNEIAQSESYLGHKWCNYWFHVHHLNTDTGKMSKSKGEFLTVSLLEQKGYDPMVYRLFCLQSHYRRNLVFSWENLDNAVVAYEKLIARIASLKDEGEVDKEAFDQLKQRFVNALNGDLNTSVAVTSLYDVLKAKCSDATKLALLADFDQVLSLNLLSAAEKYREKQSQEAQANADPEIDALVAARTEAKKAKNFAEADRIRDELKARGIEIIDTPQGSKWRRV